MSILEPSTTPTTRQVWPRMPKPAKATKPARKPRDEREPVTIERVEVGDELSFIAEGRDRRVAERVGTVRRITMSQGRRGVVSVATETGVFPLTRKNWDERAPRR